VGVLLAPSPGRNDLVAPEFCESCRPVGDDTGLDERFEKGTEGVRSRGEELRTMVELEGICASRRHAAPDAAGFLEYDDVVRVREFARHDEAGKPGANYRYRRHCSTVRETGSKRSGHA
jgi:hypothetical protein